MKRIDRICWQSVFRMLLTVLLVCPFVLTSQRAQSANNQGPNPTQMKEIEASIRLLFEQHRLVVEGSGALGVGGLLKRKERFKGKKVVAVVCGRNIDLEVFKRIIQ